MYNALNYIRVVMSVTGGVIASALGGCDMLLTVLATCVAFDYISGVVLAVKQGKLNSRVGFFGIVKKALIFVVVIIAHLLDQLTGLDAIRSITVLFYISNEGISILENLGKLGVEIPKKIRDVLEQLEDKDDDNSEDTKSDN